MEIKELLEFMDGISSKFGGHGEEQEFCKYNQYVHNPIRIPQILNNVDLINELYHNLKTTLNGKILRTKSGAIKRDMINAMGVFDVIQIYNSANNVLRGFIITAIVRNIVYVFKLGRLTNKKENTMTGKKAFNILVNELSKDGIHLSDYIEKDGKKYKEQIEKYPIVNFVLKKHLYHVNHLDLNQAWPSALSRAMPEFRKTFSRLDKSVLNSAIGYCQSQYCDFKLSKLPMLGINATNDLIYEMAAKLDIAGFEVVGFNTDGIWYKSKDNTFRLYHDEFEGEGLDHWKNDYQDVTFYANSKGQYFIIKADGKYEYKLRGYYQYETTKPRETWNTEEDFFKAIESSVEIRFDEDDGILISGV